MVISVMIFLFNIQVKIAFNPLSQRFIISMSDRERKIKLRGETAEEVKEWVDVLNAWMVYYQKNQPPGSIEAPNTAQQAQVVPPPSPRNFLSKTQGRFG